jgi:hypothetical protein
MKPDQVITQIAASSGISQEQAQTAFTASLDYIKSKLPASVSSQFNNLMDGQEFNFNAVIKEKISDMKGDVSEMLEHLKDEAKEKFDDLKEGTKGLKEKLF